MVRAAVKSAYPSIYGDLSELRQDYPEFSPRIRRWSDELIFLFGEGLYAVQMPEEEVLLNAKGEAKASRSCGSGDANCSLVRPANPSLAVVGTVQLGPTEDYARASGLEVAWEGSPGHVFVSGNCFAAYKSSDEPLVLKVKVPGRGAATIQDTYGHVLAAITLDTNGTYRGQGRISKSLFNESQTCSAEARKAWPNVGGWAWKR